MHYILVKCLLMKHFTGVHVSVQWKFHTAHLHKDIADAFFQEHLKII